MLRRYRYQPLQERSHRYQRSHRNQRLQDSNYQPRRHRQQEST